MKNKLICGDNLKELSHLPSESVDLIYIDPPFFSDRNYEIIWGDEAEIRTFEDRWEGGINVYIDWMRDRVLQLHRILKPTGSFYLHCDWHASHYLKSMCDDIFSYGNFKNEIIWKRTHSIKTSQFKNRKYPAINDTIFFYTKSNNYTFDSDQVKKLFTQDEIEQRYKYTDDKGRYTKSPVFRSMSMGERPNLCYEYKGYKNPNPAGWKVSLKRLVEIDNQGDLGWSKSGIPFRKYRPEHTKGFLLGNIWEDIKQTGGNERFGYPTQKPEALLERIIKASSNEGDIVCDAFCGCGTALTVAQKTNRQWIGIDVSPSAIALIKNRFNIMNVQEVTDYEITGMPRTIEDLKKFKPFEFQYWVINEVHGTPSPRKVGDMGIDGFSYLNHIPIQVKQSESIGRNVVDNFETALRRYYKNRSKEMKGIIIGFSFGSGTKEEVARAKKDGFDIQLVEVQDILDKKFTV